MRNTFLGLILPSVTSVFYIYLLKENFELVPDELYRAAKADGTSDFKYLWKVMIPICKPTLVTITILKMINAGIPMCGPDWLPMIQASIWYPMGSRKSVKTASDARTSRP